MPATDPPPLLHSTDPHDRELVAHVHPADWKNPEPRGRYDLVVLGAGTAGLVCAAGAAGLGARVALVERYLMGGDCLNVGCVPSKAILSAARVWHQVFEGSAFGAPPHVGTGDFPRAMARMRRLRAAIAPNDSAARFRDLGVDVFLGEGRFVSPEAVEVGGARLAFKRAVVATGGRPALPPVSGLDSVPHLTNETVFSLTSLPRRLAVLGGGPIGCELAQAFARFGSQVTLLEALPRILPRESEEAAALVAEALRRDGVRLECGAKVEQVLAAGVEKELRFASAAGESRRVRADDNADRHLLSPFRHLPPVGGAHLVPLPVHRDRVAYQDLHAIHADVADAPLRIPRHHHRQRDVWTAVLRPARDDRQPRQVDLPARPHDFLARCGTRPAAWRKFRHLEEPRQETQLGEEPVRHLKIHQLRDARADVIERCHA